MKTPRAYWIGIVIAFTGCTQLLELDQEYQVTSSTGAGEGGAAGTGGGGDAGAGGAATCTMDSDCPAVTNNCTIRRCDANSCIEENAVEGTKCGGKNVCDGKGICGQCNDVNDCTMLPPDDECQQRSCDNHVCTQTFTTAGTLLVMQTKGDCQDARCDGAGKTVTEVNDLDLPEDNNPCTKNVCTNGAPSYPNEPAQTTCGPNMFCNDAGQCVGCLTADICPGMDDFCKTRTCTNGMCGFSFTAAGIDLPTGQTTGDCKVLECDNQGNITTSIENSDLPIDNKPCTKDVCTAGIPSNPLEAANTPCGGGSICNAAGICQKANGGTCSAANDCQSGFCVEGYCCNSACAQNCKACNVPGFLGICSTVPAGYADDSCPAPQSCDGTTGASACVMKFPMGFSCTLGTQCGSGLCVDAVCCSSSCAGTCQSCNVAGSAGMCVNLPPGQKDSVNCSGQNSCDGNGGCKKDNGQTCASASECLSGNCIDGVCCETACLGTCRACNVAGLIGTCVNVPMGEEDPIATTACTGVNSCNGAGACLLDPGQPCTLNTECASNNCLGMMCQ